MSEEREKEMAEVEEHGKKFFRKDDDAGDSEVEEQRRVSKKEDDEGDSEVEEHRWRSK